MAQHHLRGALLIDLTVPIGVDKGPKKWLTAYGDQRCRRLVELKRAFDPTNVLRLNPAHCRGELMRTYAVSSTHPDRVRAPPPLGSADRHGW